MADLREVYEFNITFTGAQVTLHYPKPEIRKELVDQCIHRFKPLLERCASGNGWVAGGAVRDFFARENTESDIDIFFVNDIALANARTELEDGLKLKLLYENPSVIAYKWHGKVVQLIRQYFFSSPQECIANFDFTVCSCAVDEKGVYVHDNFFQDLAGRRLAINKLPFPLATLQRLQKYVQKGYVACNGTLLEIAKGIQTLNLDEPSENVLAFYPDGSPKFRRFD